MARTVEDTAILLNATAGYDEADTTTVQVAVPDYTKALKMPVAKLRLGIPRKPFFDAMNPDVAKAIDTALALLKKMTASIQDVTLPQVNSGSVLGAEMYSYHAPYFAKNPEMYQPPVRAALQRGSQILAGPYANSLRDVWKSRREIEKTFADVDLLLLPTMADPPFKVEDGLTRNVSARNTSVFDAYGIPVISVPCGFTSAGLPIGLQIAGAHWSEPTIFALAHAYEQATEWHLRHPALSAA
jgi:aspartyl-tRNA(Asn)/glutamyl-tRNA(Gln) amidotransferase subunit A